MIGPARSPVNPFPPLPSGDRRHGSATIRKGGSRVNPLIRDFWGSSRNSLKGQGDRVPGNSTRAALEAGRTHSGGRQCGPRRRKKRGKSTKTRKACLGWNSRQDGGRLAERSGTLTPFVTAVQAGDARRHHREGAGSLSTLPLECESSGTHPQSPGKGILTTLTGSIPVGEGVAPHQSAPVQLPAAGQ